MFTQLSEKLGNVFSKLKNTGLIREKDIETAIREVRLALLEADVHFHVVKDLLGRIKGRALGADVGALTPEQQFLKIVEEELVFLLGGEKKNLVLEGEPPHVILMVGLQGSGKTTTAAKLALHFKKKGRRPFLTPADLNRPAAVEQLRTLARQIDVPSFETDLKKNLVENVKGSIEDARKRFCEIVIVDTAGRLHIDDAMMGELKFLQKELTAPHILFVADAMTGQEAVTVTKAFHETLTIDGVILTKLDGDAKGGAALSIQSVARCPIHFIGVGEKTSDLEIFYPDRLVSRLLDRGDLSSLLEKANETIDLDDEQTKKIGEKLRKNQFDLEDFHAQLKQVKKLGSVSSMMKFLPGMGKILKKVDMNQAEGALKKKEAILNSMTIQERRSPQVLNGSRRLRIAKGSGTAVSDLNRFLKEFERMKEMMQGLSREGMKGILSKFRL